MIRISILRLKRVYDVTDAFLIIYERDAVIPHGLQDKITALHEWSHPERLRTIHNDAWPDENERINNRDARLRSLLVQPNNGAAVVLKENLDDELATTVEVPFDATGLRVLAYTNDENATLSIEGVEVANTRILDFPTTDADRKINIMVTAEDGRAHQRYLWWILELLRHSQYTANPLNPPYQGDFGTFAKVRVIGKCLLISLIHYNRRDSCSQSKRRELEALFTAKSRSTQRKTKRKRECGGEYSLPLLLQSPKDNLMTIPRLMLLGFIVPIMFWILVYCAIASYEPAKIPVMFDAKNLDKYPLDKHNFFAKDSGNWHYVLSIPAGVRVYGFPPGFNVNDVVQALGLNRFDLFEDWVGHEHSRSYFVDIGDIYEFEFHRAEYAMGHAWGYSMVDIKFKKDYNWWKQNRM